MKKFLIMMVITLLVIIPSIAFAADDENTTEYSPEITQEEHSAIAEGDTTYQGELDTQDIKEIRYVGETGACLYTQIEGTKIATTFIEKDTVLYIQDWVTLDDGTQWAYVKLDETNYCYYIFKDNIVIESSVDSGYIQPIKKVSSQGNKDISTYSENGTESSTGGDSYTRTFRITAYCSACNSPRGSTQTASGISAHWGVVACNDLPLGTHIFVPGYGEAVVADRCAKSGVVDLYIGTTDSCHCSSAGFSGSVEITIYN